MHNWVYLLTLVVYIALDAVGDALRLNKGITPDRGRKFVYGLLWHLCEGVMVLGALAAFTFLSVKYVNGDLSWGQAAIIPAGYIVLRYCLFSPLYNVIRGNEFWYLGDSDFFDIAEKKITKPFVAPGHMEFWLPRVVFLIAIVGVIFNYL